ncbi:MULTISPECIES: 50S ribosomal protein L29 [unclassified Mycoplasma]|uniref:50S ribosomal protein L29 n=1 Tax=unclassified Mycoplasma TaxID=2683645 RepID=UPI002B1DFA29|nr:MULTISPECIES: 50S ribosomal protein L29 [unclassified Mycoplasma]MEA4134554.1 50S ribosomal protein L29 [Mycoplasma sp. 2704]MEA4162777.1 50S ribosomal protein L29 [Mycoplasma sp. 4404]MEA4190945.1 50S ribosomal protein L29 [Mycoplasma sp. 2248]MEA4206349.1 50S ribosomal protein L29 [Mycoplasma sp. 1199]MEA4276508.1 50S ribosomal protein L29 [Mycoplasma sp. 21DD0573]
MLYKELKNKSVDELNTLVEQLKAELFTLRYQNVTGDLKETHKIANIRKDIAKVKTALNEKKGAK